MPPRRIWLCSDCIDWGSTDPHSEPYKSEREERGFPATTGPTTEEDRAIIRRALDVLQAWDRFDPDGIDEDTFLDMCFAIGQECESLRAALTAAGYLPESGAGK